MAGQRKTDECCRDTNKELNRCLLFTRTFFSQPHGSEDIIPERRRNAEDHIAIFVMVNTVIDPERPQEILWRLIDMHDIMDGQIVGVANEKSRQEREREITHDKAEEQQQQGGNGNAQQGRHGEAVLVLWEFMMNAVRIVLKFLSPFGVRIDVIDIPVHEVLYKGKGYESQEEEADGGSCVEGGMRDIPIKERNSVSCKNCQWN